MVDADSKNIYKTLGAYVYVYLSYIQIHVFLYVLCFSTGCSHAPNLQNLGILMVALFYLIVDTIICFKAPTSADAKLFDMNPPQIETRR